LRSTPADNELYRRIDEVIHYLWDPIGISPNPQARDEYLGYLPVIYRHVQAEELDTIIEYMQSVVTERMCMSFDKARATQAAEIMLEWKQLIENRPAVRS
jgi:hypothetical protein